MCFIEIMSCITCCRPHKNDDNNEVLKPPVKPTVPKPDEPPVKPDEPTGHKPDEPPVKPTTVHKPNEPPVKPNEPTVKPDEPTGHKPDEPTGHKPDEPIVGNIIYRLHEPKNGVKPEIDIVFFHGLQLGDYKKAYLHTWESVIPAVGDQQPRRTICWPREWLGKEDFPKARILSISYNAQAFGMGQNLRDIVKTVLLNLITHAGVGQNRPVILVGQSLGGLLIKNMCLEAVRLSDATGAVGDTGSHAREFLQNTLGVIFYGTPHGGAPLADVVRKLDIFQMASPILKFLADQGQLTELTDDFNQYRRKWNWKTYGLGEVLPIKVAGVKTLVVPEEYGRRDKVDLYATVDSADHFSICKPDSKTHQSYKWTKSHVKYMLEKEFEAVIDRPYRAVRGLSCSEKVDEAVRYIQNIPDNNQEISKQLLEAGVMLSLMEVLKSDSSERKREATWALDNLAKGSQLKKVRLEAGKAGAIKLLVDNMLNDKKTVYPGLYCLRILTVEVENRRKLKTCWSKELEKLLEGLKNDLTARDYVDPTDGEELVEIVKAARDVLESMHDVA